MKSEVVAGWVGGKEVEFPNTVRVAVTNAVALSTTTNVVCGPH